MQITQIIHSIHDHFKFPICFMEFLSPEYIALSRIETFHQLAVPNFVLSVRDDPRLSKREVKISTFNFRISFLKRFVSVRITSASCFEFVHYTHFIS